MIDIRDLKTIVHIPKAKYHRMKCKCYECYDVLKNEFEKLVIKQEEVKNG